MVVALLLLSSAGPYDTILLQLARGSVLGYLDDRSSRSIPRCWVDMESWPAGDREGPSMVEGNTDTDISPRSTKTWR